MADACSKCNKKLTGINDTHRLIYKGETYCIKCSESFRAEAEEEFRKEVEEKFDTILLTTTNNFDGYRIKRYIGIESSEIVMGTGIFSELSSSLSDAMGNRSTGFESKMQKAKRDAFDKLKVMAIRIGGNAVVGIDIDYSEFSGNRTAIIANGTVVEIEPIK